MTFRSVGIRIPVVGFAQTSLPGIEVSRAALDDVRRARP